MEEYKASVQGVDEALARLNATLASYKVSGNLPRKSAADLVTDSGSLPTSSAGETSAVPKEALGTLKHHIFQVVSKVVSEPVDWETWTSMSDAEALQKYPEIQNDDLRQLLIALSELFNLVEEQPYCLLVYLELANVYLLLGYPDLAAGAAYKALLLTDAVRDDSDEYHEQAYEIFAQIISRVPAETRLLAMERALDKDPERYLTDADICSADESLVEDDYETLMAWCENFYQRATYKTLIRSLMLCGDLSAAGLYMEKGLAMYKYDDSFIELDQSLKKLVESHYGKSLEDLDEDERTARDWPSASVVRREVYPWSEYEPDRFAEVDEINEMINDVAPKFEVKAVELPALTGTSVTGISKQLGVFAKEDVGPGELVLDETSLLTVNNRLQDMLCDACSSDIPDLKSVSRDSVAACSACEVVFCSQECYDAAMENYHPAVCETDAESILKDPEAKNAANSLYSLLLLRCFALAETRGCHPLDLQEIKYIWGDFHFKNVDKEFQSPNPSDPAANAFAGLPRSLPFSFEYNISLPFHMLEKMDIDIFANPQYDVWVFNTLFSKFRGTASARLSGSGGSVARGPDVCAVHPMWCLANHSCDPTVTWEWGGSIKMSTRKERAAWQGRDGKKVFNAPGLKKGEEILNHYCDLDLPVQERREWARGALGGDCQCERCLWEDEQQKQG